MSIRPIRNDLLFQAIKSTNATYEVVASEVRAVAALHGETLQTNRSAVAYWIKGGTPSGRVPEYIAEALSRRAGRRVTLAEIGLGSEDGDPFELSSDPVAAAADLGREMHRRDVVAAALFSASAIALPLTYDADAASRMLRARRPGAAVGEEEIVTARAMTAVMTAADERHGGGHGLTMVTSYLTDTVLPMLDGKFRSEQGRRAAFAAAAELAYLAGWKHHDLGREARAQRYYLVGYQLAAEADPHGHAAFMMRALAHQALNLNRPEHCVDLVEGALRRAAGRTDPHTYALLLITSARAYSAVGQPRRAAASLLAAEDYVLKSADDVPTYAMATGPVAATVASHAAKTLADLGQHGEAERQHRTALAGRDAGAYRRVHAMTIGNLARTVAAQNRPDEAVHLWADSLDHTAGVSSDRQRRELLALRSTMAGYRVRGIPGAADVDQRARDLLAA